MFKISKNNFKIIVYGGENFSKIDADLLIKIRLMRAEYFLNDDHIKLSELYCNVEALVYPSVYEGFGIPILEAMKMDVLSFVAMADLYKKLEEKDYIILIHYL